MARHTGVKKSTRRVAAGVVVVGLMAASCSSGSVASAPVPHDSAPPAKTSSCTSRRDAKTVVLRLTDNVPDPRVEVAVGERIMVIAKFGHGHMRLPRVSSPRTAAAICVSSLRRRSDGSTVGHYVARRRARVSFVSSFRIETDAMDPYLGGVAVIRSAAGK